MHPKPEATGGKAHYGGKAHAGAYGKPPPPPKVPEPKRPFASAGKITDSTPRQAPKPRA